MTEETHGKSYEQELPQREAGGAKPKHVRLSAHPAPYNPTPRDEPGPEARPPATIKGVFRPIEDMGPATVAPSQYPRTRDTSSGTQAADGEAS